MGWTAAPLGDDRVFLSQLDARDLAAGHRIAIEVSGSARYVLPALGNGVVIPDGLWKMELAG